MHRSRNEVGRWRMLRQSQRRRHRWLEGQSRRYNRIHRIRAENQLVRQQRALLFVNSYGS